MRAFIALTIFALVTTACAPEGPALRSQLAGAAQGLSRAPDRYGLNCLHFPAGGPIRVLLDQPRPDAPEAANEVWVLMRLNGETFFEAPVENLPAPGGMLTLEGPPVEALPEGEKTLQVQLLAGREEALDEMELTFDLPPRMELFAPEQDEFGEALLAVAGRPLAVQVAFENLAAEAIGLEARAVDDLQAPVETGRRVGGRRGLARAAPSTALRTSGVASAQEGVVTLEWNAPDGLRETEMIVFARAELDRAALCSYHRKAFAVTVPDDFDELAGEYFIEIMLGMWFDGSKSLRTSRFTSDPVFWFENGRGTQGERDVTNILTQAVPELTGGRFKAQFRTDASPPADPSQVITIRFNSNFNQGISIPEADHNNGGGIRLTGGEINLASAFMQGVDQWNVALVKHEAAHVLVGHGTHSAIRGSILAKGWSDPVVQPYEKAAWDLFYQLPVDVSLAQLQAAGIITQAMVDVEPIVTKSQPANSMSGPRLEAAAGDTIWINGRRLWYPWQCGISIPHPSPVIDFNGVKATGSKVTGVGGDNDCNWVEVVVPQGATTGPLTVTAYGQTSAPVQFTVKP